MKTGLKFGLAAAAVMIAVPIGLSIVSTTATVATAPGRVISKTLQTDNIINTYEGFFARKAAYDARLGQIADHEALTVISDDPDEVIRLRIELSAMRQSCRELAAKYNADAGMMNKSMFRDGSLPTTISELECDA